MSKGTIMLYVIFPIVFTLSVYGIFIVARLKKTGWDIKGLLIVTCFVLPIIGFIITLVASSSRNKRLKKEELESQNAAGTAGDLPHKWFYFSWKEFKIIIFSFVIGQTVYSLIILFTIYNVDREIKRFTTDQINEALMSDTALVNQIRRDSISQQERVDSIKSMQLKNSPSSR